MMCLSRLAVQLPLFMHWFPGSDAHVWLTRNETPSQRKTCVTEEIKQNPKMVTSASLWTRSSLLVLTKVQLCNTVVSVIHSQQRKSNTNRCLVTGISLVWSTKALMHIWRLPMFPMNVSTYKKSFWQYICAFCMLI